MVYLPERGRSAAIPGFVVVMKGPYAVSCRLQNLAARDSVCKLDDEIEVERANSFYVVQCEVLVS